MIVSTVEFCAAFNKQTVPEKHRLMVEGGCSAGCYDLFKAKTGIGVSDRDKGWRFDCPGGSQHDDTDFCRLCGII